MKVKIHKKNGNVYICMILKHKEQETYSFINLTKNHICPCKFTSIQDAIKELQHRNDILSYEILE